MLDLFFIASTHWDEYFRDYFNAETPRLLYLSRYQHIFHFMNGFWFHCLFIYLGWISFVIGRSHYVDVFPNGLCCTCGTFFFAHSVTVSWCYSLEIQCRLRGSSAHASSASLCTGLFQSVTVWHNVTFVFWHKPRHNIPTKVWVCDTWALGLLQLYLVFTFFWL